MTWAEFDALAARYHEEQESAWSRSSIVATAIYNVNRGEDSESLPLDYFVPNRSKPEPEEIPQKASPEALKARFRSLTKKMGGTVNGSD